MCLFLFVFFYYRSSPPKSLLTNAPDNDYMSDVASTNTDEAVAMGAMNNNRVGL